MKSKALSQDDIQLDSFLDIVTNVIGVLILIACAIALQVQNYQPPKKSPIMIEAPQNLKKVSFICSKDRVLRIDHRKLYDELHDKASSKFGDRYTWNQLIELCNSETDFSEYLKMTMQSFDSEIVQVCYEVSDKKQDANSIARFEQTLSNTDSENTLIFFYVFGDGFSVFPHAKSLAKQSGFRVGWKPIPGSKLCWTVMSPNSTQSSGGAWEMESD